MRELDGDNVPDRLLNAIRHAPLIPEDEIEAYVSRNSGRLGVTRNGHPYRHDDPRTELTGREVDVLTAFSHGLTTEMVADLLAISLETVKSHSKNARYTLDAKTTLHAVAIALRRGLIS